MMKTLLRILWHLVAWGWLACVALALLQTTDIIEITQSVSIGLRVATFLLVLPASRYFGLRWLGCTLWVGLLGLTIVGVITFFAGGFFLFYLPYKFFIYTEPWQTTFVHSSRGNLRYVKQTDSAGDGTRDVVLVPVTPWTNMPRPPAAFDVQHWTPINKALVYLGPDSAQQTAEDRRAYRYRSCSQQTARLDSLDHRHLLPPQVLPAATRQGAGTLGYLLGKRVWCAPLRPLPKPYFCKVVWGGARQMQGNTAFFLIEADRLYERVSISLPYPLPQKPGRWRGNLSLEQPDGNHRTNYWYSAPNSTVLTVTRLDTVAHIIAGTFSGTLYLPYPKDMNSTKKIPYSQLQHLPVSQGRFDLHYTPGVYQMRP